MATGYQLPGALSEGTEEDKDASQFRDWTGSRLAPDDALRAAATRQVTAATEATVASLGAWVASTLVRLADLELKYLPPPEPDGS